MRLKLIFGDNEKDDELHGRVVERVEFRLSSKFGHDFFEPIGRAMWNGNPESDAGAHRFLTLFERSQNAVAIRGFDFAQANEQVD